MQERIRVIFAGGGTGGHVFPAIYIAQYLKKNWGADCLFLGTKRGLENLKVSQAGFAVKFIWIRGFRRGFYPGNLLFPLRLLVSLIQSRRELRQFRPDLVIGTGGYVAGPVLYQAKKLNIPAAIQEQNSYPGITTRLLAPRVDLVFLAYKEALKYLKNVKKHIIIGNPVRDNLNHASRETAAKYFQLDKNQKTILVFGGSQGALTINQAIDHLIATGLINDVQILWQTGKLHFEGYKKKYGTQNLVKLHIVPFIDRMDLAYACSDFAVCRAGAMTISELAAAGLPSILVPLRHAAADHQMKNARAVSKAGGALVVEDGEEMRNNLETAIRTMLKNEDQVHTMAMKIKKFHDPETTAKIAQALSDLLKEKSRTKN